MILLAAIACITIASMATCYAIAIKSRNAFRRELAALEKELQAEEDWSTLLREYEEEFKELDAAFPSSKILDKRRTN